MTANGPHTVKLHTPTRPTLADTGWDSSVGLINKLLKCSNSMQLANARRHGRSHQGGSLRSEAANTNRRSPTPGVALNGVGGTRESQRRSVRQEFIPSCISK